MPDFQLRFELYMCEPTMRLLMADPLLPDNHTFAELRAAINRLPPFVDRHEARRLHGLSHKSPSIDVAGTLTELGQPVTTRVLAESLAAHASE